MQPVIDSMHVTKHGKMSNQQTSNFQTILWNHHLLEITKNQPRACAGHDPLHKVRNIINMT